MKASNKPASRWTIPVAIIFGLLFVLIFLLSSNTIWILDSIEYQYNFATRQPIGSVCDIFQSQYAHYFTWNGRYVAHWLCQFFLALVGKTGFSICNGLVYIIYVLVIMRYVGLSPRVWRSVLLTTLLVLFFCDTIYAPNWQISYVWTFCLTLVFLMVFFSDRCKTTKNFGLLLLLFLFTIISGNGHEGFNIGVGISLCIYILVNLRSTTLAQYVMLVGFGLGGLIICLSPATMGRASTQSIPLGFTVLHMVLDFRSFYLLLLLIAVRLLRGTFNIKVWYRENFFEVNTILVLILFNIYIGVGGARQLMGVELMSVIVILRMVKSVKIHAFWLGAATVVILCIYGLKFAEVYKSQVAYTQLKDAIRDREGEIEYVDLPSYNGLVNPTNPLKYGVYFYYVIWSALTDINGEFFIGDVDFRVYPTQVRDLLARQNPSDTVIEYLSGEFLVLLTDSSESRVVLHRQLEMLGVKLSLPDAEITLNDENSSVEGVYRVLYLPDNMPLVTNTGVEILHDGQN